ncbi:MAG: hypothetical protein AB7M12_11965 [Hyphomonadaceae bacterium]
MAKVIVERPRLGSKARARPGRDAPLLDDDGEPLRVRAPKRTRQQKTKRLNENLAPLRRFLAAQAGRPWRKVYSEISEHLKPTSTVQQHVRDHVGDIVALHCRMRAGEVWVATDWSGEHPLARDTRKLYVHPRTGLLLRNPKAYSIARAFAEARAAEAAERAARMRELAPGVQAHLLGDGAWWEVRLKRRRRPLGEQNADLDVVLSAGLSTLDPEKLYGRHGVFAVAKRQFNKAEKKRLGLP